MSVGPTRQHRINYAARYARLCRDELKEILSLTRRIFSYQKIQIGWEKKEIDRVGRIDKRETYYFRRQS